MIGDWVAAVRIPSLRALIVGTAAASGALTGIGFWIAAYHQRHSGMDPAQAGALTGALILVGAIVGILVGGRVGDRMRLVSPGAPMVAAGVSMTIGAILMLLSVQEVPVWTARVPLQILAVAFLVATYPATNALTGEVTPGWNRGTAFSLFHLATILLGAFSPPLFGWLAQQHAVAGPNGEMVGDLGFAFQASLPLVLIGATVLMFGGRSVQRDRERALGHVDG